MRPSLKRPCTSLLLGGRADAAQVARPVVHYYDSLSLSSPAQERKGKEEESLGWEGLSAGVLPHPPLPRPCCCGSASPPSRNHAGAVGGSGSGGGEMRGFLRSSSSGCCRCPRAPPRPRARGAVLRTVSHLLSQQLVEAAGLLQRVQALSQPWGPEEPEVESHQSLTGDGGQGPWLREASFDGGV